MKKLLLLALLLPSCGTIDTHPYDKDRSERIGFGSNQTGNHRPGYGPRHTADKGDDWHWGDHEVPDRPTRPRDQ